jgi:threonine dehydratase
MYRFLNIRLFFFPSRIVEKELMYLHSFDDDSMIEGAGTIAQEIMKDLEGDLDFCLIPVGGGGLAAGISLVLSQMSPDT